MADSNTEREPRRERKGFWVSERDIFYLLLFAFVGQVLLLVGAIANQAFVLGDRLLDIGAIFANLYFLYSFRRRRPEPLRRGDCSGRESQAN